MDCLKVSGRMLSFKASVTVSWLLQIASTDKDFRYMATSDLQNELAKPTFKTNDDTEKRLCNAILQQLDDTSGDISGLAVKWHVYAARPL